MWSNNTFITSVKSSEQIHSSGEYRKQNKFDECSTALITTRKKEQIFQGTDYYEDYTCDNTNNTSYGKPWQGMHLMYPPEPINPSPPGGPILMMSPSGEIRMMGVPNPSSMRAPEVVPSMYDMKYPPIGLNMQDSLLNCYYPPQYGVGLEDPNPYHRQPMNRSSMAGNNQHYPPLCVGGMSPSPAQPLPPRHSPIVQKVSRPTVPIDGYIYQVFNNRIHINTIMYSSDFSAGSVQKSTSQLHLSALCTS